MWEYMRIIRAIWFEYMEQSQCSDLELDPDNVERSDPDLVIYNSRCTVLPHVIFTLTLSCRAHCKENPFYVFLFWELRGLSRNFHIHVSLSHLYIPRIDPHVPCSRIGRQILEIYCINLSQIYECRN
jgi:hypothetical protein